jgi:hypothetical protein
MPGGDRTGPLGAGPRTGRAAGFCAGYGMPGFANSWLGRGFGRGGGFGYGFGGGHGRGWRHRFFATGIPGRGWGRGWFGPGYGYQAGPGYAPGYYYEDERSALMEEAEYLRSALDSINRRLDKLQTNKEGDQKG